jgi:putative DNA primase/helicase
MSETDATPRTAVYRQSSSIDEIVASLKTCGFEFAYNMLMHRIEVSGMALTDGISAVIRARMREIGAKSMAEIEDAYTTHALHNPYHPIVNYYNDLKWDGEKHIERLASYFESPEPPFDDGETVPIKFMRRWLIGCVSKMIDHTQLQMLVFEGAQNTGKSYFAHWLASPLPQYFSEGPIRPDDKDSLIRLASSWIWEVSELGATIRRADIEALKGFITTQTISVRRAYGKHEEQYPATAALIGTVNDNGVGFLNDTTGSRRSLIIPIKSINWKYSTEVDINQVWAQAVALYQSGEESKLDDMERSKHQEINVKFDVTDPVEDVIDREYDIDITRMDWFTPAIEIVSAVDLVLHGTSAIHARAVSTTLKKRGVISRTARYGDRVMRGYYGIRKHLTPL